LNYSE
ncbi:hypothetical protein VCHC67A1_01301B, partial [Vibrio cholerae HC-67A1]